MIAFFIGISFGVFSRWISSVDCGGADRKDPLRWTVEP
jgi:hypothetical protein